MPAPLMSSLPAQTQPENASNSTNEVTKSGPIWHFSKSSYVEIIQLITLIVLWVVAARSYPLEFLEYIFPLSLIVGLPYKAFIKYDDLQAEGRPAVEASSSSRTIKVTGYRLASTVLTLCLAIAKFSLSTDKSASSDYLDLAGFLVALTFVWIGYYSEVHDTFAPWFFQKDYSPSLGKGLGELGHLCLAGVCALSYFIRLDVIDVLERSFIVRTGDRDIRHVDEVKLGMYIALSLFQWPGFFLLEAGLIWGMGSAERPRPVYRKSTMFFTRTITVAYMIIILQMSLLIWRQSDPQSVMHFQMIYEKIGIKKLFICTVVTEVVGAKVP